MQTYKRMRLCIWALIKCPECRRENVSDNTNACHECGFGIKEYIDRKKKEA